MGVFNCNNVISVATVALFDTSFVTVVLMELTCEDSVDALDMSAEMTLLLDMSVVFRTVTPVRAVPII